jgi:hypothetical protein
VFSVADPPVEVPPDPGDELPPCEFAELPPDSVCGGDEEEQDTERTVKAMARVECFMMNSEWVFLDCSGPVGTVEWANRTR